MNKELGIFHYLFSIYKLISGSFSLFMLLLFLPFLGLLKDIIKVEMMPLGIVTVIIGILYSLFAIISSGFLLSQKPIGYKLIQILNFIDISIGTVYMIIGSSIDTILDKILINELDIPFTNLMFGVPIIATGLSISVMHLLIYNYYKKRKELFF